MLNLRITPAQTLMLAAIGAALVFMASATISMQQPWLGIALGSAGNGLLVEQVDESGPSSGILYPGDTIVELADMQGVRIRLQQNDIVEDPDSIPTLARRNVFRDRQSRIHQILLQPVVLMRLIDDRAVRIQPQPSRPISSFPLAFWLLSIYATTALLVGAAVWSVKQGTAAAKYLFLSGVGVSILLHAVKIITLRELALDGALYPWLTFIYHLGYNLFALGLIGLVWWFPKMLGRPMLIWGLAAFMLFFMLNELFEWMEFPGNSVLIQVPFYTVAAIVGMGAQWMGSRGAPLERAAIKAVMLVVWIVILALAGFYSSSVLLFDSSKVSLNESFVTMFVVYTLLSLLVIRYRLFDIDRWWLEIWLWFFTGVGIVSVDLALVSLVGFAPSYALAVTVFFAAWVYFPVRQWLWGKLFNRSRRSLHAYVPLLVGHFVRAEHVDVMTFWQKVLNDIFRPLSIEFRDKSISQAEIGDDGIRMYLPGLEEGSCVELYYADKGRRLFNSEDVRLAQALFNISNASIEQRESYASGITDERKRIMRDLHDDVGGRLLTLTHSAQNSSATAAEALKSLREIIYALDTEQKTTLNEAVAKWRIEALERCELAGVAFEWDWEELQEDNELSQRQALNLTLILRESLSNVFRHARAGRISVRLHVADDSLYIDIRNDGARSSCKKLVIGKGLRNIRTRAEELGGIFSYGCKDDHFHVQVMIPLSVDLPGLVNVVQ